MTTRIVTLLAVALALVVIATALWVGIRLGYVLVFRDNGARPGDPSYGPRRG